VSDYDVAVVGLGALGSAAAWQLARRGLRVIGFDRYPLGHTNGASHGDSRIIRLSYHTPAYVRSAATAFDCWAELEAESGQQLITPAGGVDVFPPGAAIDVRDYTGSLDAAGVDYDLLDPGASTARWPGLAVPDGSVVLHQARTGIVAAGLGVRVMHRQARRHGADLRESCPVRSVRENADGDGVLVTTAGGERHRAGHVVVATDGWANQLLPGDLPLTTTQEYVVHFAVPTGSHRPGRFPVWIWMDDPSYYGFPSFGNDFGEDFGDTVKVGQDCGGQEVDPDHRPGEDGEYLARMAAFVRRTVPGAGPAVRTTRCLYTLTPDRDFVLGPVPGHERVLVALGAAHGFKFAAWFGAALADLVQTGGTELEIGDFAVDRPALSSPVAAANRRWLT
jgi:sarcosine oxidase